MNNENDTMAAPSAPSAPGGAQACERKLGSDHKVVVAGIAAFLMIVGGPAVSR